MKRLFKRFEKETGLVTATVKKMSGYVEPPPPPLKWYQKLLNFILSFFRKKRVVRPTWIPDSYAGLSIAFNEWLYILWNRVGPVNPKRVGKPLNKQPYQLAFGTRINKTIIRKWTQEYELH